MWCAPKPRDGNYAFMIPQYFQITLFLSLFLTNSHHKKIRTLIKVINLINCIKIVNKDSLEHYKITNNRTKHIHFILIPFSDRWPIDHNLSILLINAQIFILWCACTHINLYNSFLLLTYLFYLIYPYNFMVTIWEWRPHIEE